jgi:hypothetical protein
LDSFKDSNNVLQYLHDCRRLSRSPKATPLDDLIPITSFTDLSLHNKYAHFSILISSKYLIRFLDPMYHLQIRSLARQAKTLLYPSSHLGPFPRQICTSARRLAPLTATALKNETGDNVKLGALGRTASGKRLNIRTYPQYDNLEDERLYRKQHLAAAFRVFSERGFDEGVAGHISG